MYRVWMLLVSLFCLVSAAVAQTADGPYIMYRTDGSVRMVSVTPEGRLVDTVMASLPEDYSFTVVSSDLKHSFDVSLHAVERPEWKSEQPDSIFVTSDPHGNLDCFISLLQGNGVIDGDCNWNFGANQLVVIGDVFDRGNDAVQILWLIYNLEAQAAQAGGRVDYLLGNHEPMVLMNDLRYAKPKYTNLADTLGMKYAGLLSPSSELGRWLSLRNTMQMSGRFLFVHAGLSSDFYRRNLDIPFVNGQVSAGLYKTKSERKEASPMIYFLMGSSGPLWYRGMVRDAEKYNPLAADTLDLILDRYQADRVIVGHTIFDDISTFYDGRVIAVNVDNTENREAGLGRGILIEGDSIYVVGDKGILRGL